MLMTGIRHSIARLFWRLSKWRLQREAPAVTGPRILLGAPHTSNLDFVFMLAIAWDARLRIHWLGKQELFRWIAGPVMRALGGIAVNRAHPERVVDQVVARVRADPQFMLVVTPEGTRRGSGWRSGFYRIAYAAELPVSLGFVDRTTRTAGLGPTLHLTGDVEADMNLIREFYRDKAGVRPELRTEPRLHDEPGLTRLLAQTD
ncbi:1-acyl-sn-glycerol-3-phosphate acyltransferase [Leucobacter salsicius]|uniref:1-acyl-sn-glycerol-3-phosphate acyltransferase n=1 Tax=Leucobacter salsicius TaxID=664638 RepID=UPI00034D3A87|nr:1-acyl-sn-glycerol-3-phosphate acyltransferase [Leucobacter salsicius]